MTDGSTKQLLIKTEKALQKDQSGKIVGFDKFIDQSLERKVNTNRLNQNIIAKSTRNRTFQKFDTEIADRLKLTNAINSLNSNEKIRPNLNNR